jgi:hypothetical protein
VAVTGNVVLVVSTRASINGTLVVTVTSTALLPSPLGEVTTDGLTPLDRPFNAAMLEAALVASVLLEPDEL